LGVARVLAQQATARPRGPKPRRQLRPRVAARETWERIEALRKLMSFLSSYRSALSAWREGTRVALFPPGTYLMRVMHGAVCAGAG
jgi:putative transposase